MSIAGRKVLWLKFKNCPFMINIEEFNLGSIKHTQKKRSNQDNPSTGLNITANLSITKETIQ